LQRNPLHHAGEEQSRGSQEVAGAGATGRQRALEALRLSGPRAGHRGGEEMIDLSKTIDLSTTYLGLKLKNPLVASSSPVCEDLGNVRRLEDAGASAVVLQSLFEEQIEHESDELDRYIDAGSEIGAESVTHFPELARRVTGSEGYLT